MSRAGRVELETFAHHNDGCTGGRVDGAVVHLDLHKPFGDSNRQNLPLLQLDGSAKQRAFSERRPTAAD